MWTDAVWAVLTSALGLILALGAGFEIRALWSKQRGDTYSEWFRPWAKRHPLIFGVLCGTLVGLGLWLPDHIL